MVILYILFHTFDSRQASEVSKTLSRVNKLKLCIYLEHMLQLLLDLLSIALRKIFLLLPIGGFGVACSE